MSTRARSPMCGAGRGARGAGPGRFAERSEGLLALIHTPKIATPRCGGKRALEGSGTPGPTALQDCAHGLLDLSYPTEESLSDANFADRAAVELAMRRLDLLIAWIGALLGAFDSCGADSGARVMTASERRPAEG